MADSAPAGQAAALDLACFEVKGGIYAVEVTFVREIVRLVEVTPLPDAPALIEGVVDLRGAVLPVLDLARVLGRGPSQPGPRSRIVVLALDGLAFGVQVDAATDVISIDAARLEDVPELATQAGYDVVRHVVRRPDESPVMVLALETLVERVYRSALRTETLGSKSGPSVEERV